MGPRPDDPRCSHRRPGDGRGRVHGPFPRDHLALPQTRWTEGASVVGSPPPSSAARALDAALAEPPRPSPRPARPEARGARHPGRAAGRPRAVRLGPARPDRRPDLPRREPRRRGRPWPPLLWRLTRLAHLPSTTARITPAAFRTAQPSATARSGPTRLPGPTVRVRLIASIWPPWPLWTGFEKRPRRCRQMRVKFGLEILAREACRRSDPAVDRRPVDAPFNK